MTTTAGTTYNLHTLGWHSFQQLCLTIATQVLGQTVTSFLDSRDGGRDGAFTGTWQPTGHESLTGQFVIQCKFTSSPTRALRTSDLSDEIAKAKTLVARGLLDSYVLMTNAGLSGLRAAEIHALLAQAGVRHIAVFGSTWINQKIRENRRLRMLVPRLYGLGDLSQILDERAYAQARAILETLLEDLTKVVVTAAYRRAAHALDKHSFVLLIGEPAAGKTTIASLLAMAAVDNWSASLLKLDDPDTMTERWNPDEPTQFFWLDDAFGVTQYEDVLVDRWNHVLPQIRTMLRKGAKIVMTSRDYIYNRARSDLKETAFPLLQESQVVIDVHDLSDEEKRQILYNHLKLGRQPVSFRTEIKPHLETVAIHKRFIPETARRLSDPLFTRELSVDPHCLDQFIEKREQFLHEVLNGLDRDSKAALALIYMRNDRLQSPIDLQPSEAKALLRLGSDLGGCVASLDALNGSLVLHVHAGGESLWRFKHPTIGDAYAEVLVQSPELLGIYVQGSMPERLMSQVTCGDVGIDKAVILPKSLFSLMLARLRSFTRSGRYKSVTYSVWGGRWALYGFLSRRCSKEFLSLYIKLNSDLLDRVSTPGLYLDAVQEVPLARRLHEWDLLPESKRKRFVETVSGYATRGEDVAALDDEGVRSLFRDDEFETLRQKVRLELLPRLEDVRLECESTHFLSSDLPEEHIQQLLTTFETLKKCFGDDEGAMRIIDCQTQRANEWVDENTGETPERSSRELGNVEAPEQTQGTRSIFDDIDA